MRWAPNTIYPSAASATTFCIVGFAPNAPYDTPEKIVSFGSLREGWHFGQGGPADRQTIRTALDVYLQISAGFAKTGAFSGAGREILVTGYRGSEYLGVIVEPTGYISVRYEVDDDEVFYLENITLPQAEEVIRSVAGESWNTYGYFIPRTTIMREKGSMISVSKTWTEECPWFIGNVLSREAE